MPRIETNSISRVDNAISYSEIALRLAWHYLAHKVNHAQQKYVLSDAAAEADVTMATVDAFMCEN